jgi:Fur family ferric uptake transcriptional regulator
MMARAGAVCQILLYDCCFIREQKALDNKDLKKAGLKVTLPRVKILQILEKEKDHHVSAEDVYRILLESGDDIGLATVYRVLTQFEEAGLVVRHNFAEGHSVFELDHGMHHDHLVCVKCGLVEEFVDSVIEERQKHVAEKAGFSITDHSLNIYGICAACKNK